MPHGASTPAASGMATMLYPAAHQRFCTIDQSLARTSSGQSSANRASADGNRVQGLPLYSYDYDKNYPAVATAFKDAITAMDAVLFVTPEYNRSIPGALKNAIDWASRPYGTNAFTRKPSAVIGTSPGKIGTAVAQQHLRSILAFCNSPLMNSIEAYIQFEDGLINEDGSVSDGSTREFLQNYMAEFHGFIARVYTVLPRSV